MRELLIESHFLPSIEYFCALLPYETVCLEAHEHYVKQSYRNRCYVLAVNGVERLTVPLTNKHGKVPIQSIQIDYSYRWQSNFWRTLQSAYAHSPYFEHYRDDLRELLFSGEASLFNFNDRILSMCLHWLGWRKEITKSTTYEQKTLKTDLRNVILAKQGFQSRSIFRPNPYQQVFGSSFVPNLSILDLVCCLGPEAGHYIITASTGDTLNKRN